MQTKVCGMSGNTALLPQLTVDFDEEQADTFSDRVPSMLARKVVLNASMLIDGQKGRKQCAQTVANCLADAAGLFVDFGKLGI